MKNYGPKEPSKFISDLDINNLCGWGMSKFLPYEGFKWLKNVDNFDVNSINENSSIGYVLEVLSWISWRIIWDTWWLSVISGKTCNSLWHVVRLFFKKCNYGIKVGNVEKLIPNLGGKTNYVVH